jgi:hypothetical protein
MEEEQSGVKRKLLKIFDANRDKWLTVSDIRKFFAPNEKGVNSIQQHKTFLCNAGFQIEKRHREGGTWEYQLKTPLNFIDWDNLCVFSPIEPKTFFQEHSGQ